MGFKHLSKNQVSARAKTLHGYFDAAWCVAFCSGSMIPSVTTSRC